MKILHKNMFIGIIFISLSLAVMLLNDHIGRWMSNILLNLILALTTGFLGLVWGLVLAFVMSSISLFDGTVSVIPSFLTLLAGNVLYVLVLKVSPGVIEHSVKPFLFLTPMLGAALLKYFVQFFLAIKFLPLLFNLPEMQREELISLYSSGQLTAALIGSILGISMVKIFNFFLERKLIK